MFKKLIIAASITLAYCGMAAAVTIDANGGVAGDGGLSVGALDWNAGNGLAVAAPGESLAVRTPGQIFQFYGHSTLSAFNDLEGNGIGGTGLNSAYEWSYVTAFQETILEGDPSIRFATVAGGTNFFQIYYNAPPNGNQLTGQGFNDGTLILQGIVLPNDFVSNPGGNSSFNVTDGTANEALDRFGVDNYPAIDTIEGNGSSTLLVEVTDYDIAFFQALPDIISLDFDTFQNLAFNQTNPSACFWDGAAFIGGAGGQGTDCANTIGDQNGTDGPNVQFQTDAISSFEVAAVPEPTSVALLGLGLAALGFSGTRRRKSIPA